MGRWLVEAADIRVLGTHKAERKRELADGLDSSEVGEAYVKSREAFTSRLAWMTRFRL